MPDSRRSLQEGGAVEGLGYCDTRALGPHQLLESHMCIRLTVHNRNSSVVTIIGVYMPCIDKGMDCYQHHLLQLEKLISESSLVWAVIILNAHLGNLGGVRGRGDPNVQGVLVHDMLSRCNLGVLLLDLCEWQ